MTAVDIVQFTWSTFGTFSGYELNIGKSDLINPPELDIMQYDLHFTLSQTTFEYLGINISQNVS